MNFIFSELKILKEQAASDFQATMLALSTVQSAMQAQHRTQEARLDRLEEAVHLLEGSNRERGEAS